MAEHRHSITGGPFSVRRAAIGDEPVLRELRLRATTDSPDAFGSTYERELARTDEDWRRWMSPGVTFYERNGFQSTGHERIRERDGWIEIRMERAC